MTESIAIQPIDRFTASLRLPGSKSLTNRALLLAALARGHSRLSHVLLADDSRVMLEALRSLEFDIRVDEVNRIVEIDGASGWIPADGADLFLGNAGTAYRFLTAACCLGLGPYRLDGVPRMRQRPIGPLVDALRHIGAEIEYAGDAGFPPLVIGRGDFAGGSIHMPATLSSQFTSALLQVGPVCRDGLILNFDAPIISLPYVQMTLELMKRFGASYTVEGRWSSIAVGPSGYHGIDYAIEPDASNASYFLAAAAINPGSVCTVQGLGRDSLQGDVRFAQVLGQMGAEVEVHADSITVTGPDALDGIDINLNHMPDMAQTLAVVSLFARGGAAIRDVGNLRVKETDRLAALRNELTKLGAQVRIQGDDLFVQMDTPGDLRPASIDTYDDHRMAMSFAVAGLRSPGVVIHDPACVNKTFPEFWQYLLRLGAAEARTA
jgi:3-phosphoshikimate 1-carboxyvinyltransferase